MCQSAWWVTNMFPHKRMQDVLHSLRFDVPLDRIADFAHILKLWKWDICSYFCQDLYQQVVLWATHISSLGFPRFYRWVQFHIAWDRLQLQLQPPNPKSDVNCQHFMKRGSNPKNNFPLFFGILYILKVDLAGPTQVILLAISRSAISTE